MSFVMHRYEFDRWNDAIRKTKWDRYLRFYVRLR